MSTPWDEAPLDDLIDHIVAAYHRPLPDVLADLGAMARRAYGAALERPIAELREHLVEHTRREEELVFPWLRERDARAAGALVNLLEHEHDDTARRIDALAAVAGESAPLAAHLGALRRELAEHIRLENRVLFPRALVKGIPC